MNAWSLVCLAAVNAAVLAFPVGAAETKKGRTTFEDVERQTKETLRTIRSYGYDHRQEYREKLKAVLARLDREMDTLRRKASMAAGKAREQYHKELAELRPLRERAHAWLKKTEEATPGAWEELKKGVGSAFDDLQRGVKNAWHHYQQQQQQ